MTEVKNHDCLIRDIKDFNQDCISKKQFKDALKTHLHGFYILEAWELILLSITDVLLAFLIYSLTIKL